MIEIIDNEIIEIDEILNSIYIERKEFIKNFYPYLKNCKIFQWTGSQSFTDKYCFLTLDFLEYLIKKEPDKLLIKEIKVITKRFKKNKSEEIIKYTDIYNFFKVGFDCSRFWDKVNEDNFGNDLILIKKEKWDIAKKSLDFILKYVVSFLIDLKRRELAKHLENGLEKILCEKCDNINPFHSIFCNYCGSKIIK